MGMKYNIILLHDTEPELTLSLRVSYLWSTVQTPLQAKYLNSVIDSLVTYRNTGHLHVSEIFLSTTFNINQIK